MAFNIQDFKSNGLIYGGARPSLFDVTVFTPFGSTTEPRAKMLVQASELPSSPIQEIPVYYFGRPIKEAGNREFPDWTVEVLNDEDFALKLMFEKWSNKINAMISNRASTDTFTTGYKSNGLVTQYKQSGPIAVEYELTGIWPKIISPIKLSWRDGNAIETYTVQFSVDWWEPVTMNTNAPDKYSGTVAPDGVSSNPVAG